MTAWAASAAGAGGDAGKPEGSDECALGTAEASHEWLCGALQEERDALTSFLEQRHAALLARLADRCPSHGANDGLRLCAAGGGADEETPPGPPLVGVPAEESPTLRATVTSDASHVSINATNEETNTVSIADAKTVQPPKPAWATHASERSGFSRSSSRMQRSKTSVFLEGAMVESTMGAGFSERARALVTNPAFESFFAVAILVNAVIMALEAQYKGLTNGFVIKYVGFSSGPGPEIWPWADTLFHVLEWSFGCLFVAELLFKIAGLKMDFVKDVWNWLDAFLVVTWMLSSTDSVQLPVNPTLLRTFRLCRLLRLLKLVRSMRGFDALVLMTTAMRGSFGILAWAVIVIVAAQMIIAVCLQASLEGFILDEAVPPETRQNVFKFYGTFSRTMLTMFEITFGNWMPPCRALVENVSEWYMLFSICHKLLIGFSVVSVINGVFIQETFKVAGADDQIMTRAQEKANKSHRNKMQALFEAADANGDGTVDREEFEEVLRTGTVRTWLAAMGLAVEDGHLLFTLLDSGNGTITLEEMMQGVGKLKGAARSLDVLCMMKEIQKTQVLVKQMCEELNLSAGSTANQHHEDT